MAAHLQSPLFAWVHACGSQFSSIPSPPHPLSAQLLGLWFSGFVPYKTLTQDKAFPHMRLFPSLQRAYAILGCCSLFLERFAPASCASPAQWVFRMIFDCHVGFMMEQTPKRELRMSRDWVVIRSAGKIGHQVCVGDPISCAALLSIA